MLLPVVLHAEAQWLAPRLLLWWLVGILVPRHFMFFLRGHGFIAPLPGSPLQRPPLQGLPYRVGAQGAELRSGGSSTNGAP